MPKRIIRNIIAGRPLHTLGGNTSVLAAAKKMADENIGAMLVVDGENLLGVFTERDALCRVLAKGLNPETTRVSEVMTSRPLTISADKALSHALLIMHDNGFRHMPVVDGGKLAGIVSVRDALGQEMSELISNIAQRDALSEKMG